ncbi:hypothetical protein [Azohydromonas lata]|uniref:Uncharacterized protein n=1 Tax=Azohydromonas lata TaxID=45677 RepID=A0ABU5ICL5_9BURK|nr:hypothetical protein [Azohydromonas lata]MDZ5456829.1 hypothetical protein [Azohydromonas lata]
MSIPTSRSTASSGSIDAAAQDTFITEGGHANTCSTPARELAEADHEEQAHLMAMLGIHHEGRYYHFRSYRYTRLEDAVAYARLVGTRVARMLAEDNLPSPSLLEEVNLPTGQEEVLMQSLGVCFEDGRYVYEGFHYDRLADAVAYARLRHAREP